MSMLRSDIVFHDIVVDISRGDMELTLPEWALYRRTMTDLFNPRGPLWAFCGMAVWRKIFPRSVVSPLIVGLYCWEASWNFHEKYPVASFFRDVSLMNPSENRLAAKLRNEFPRIDGMNVICDQRGTLHRFSDFMRLKRTRLMFFGTKTAKQLHMATGVGTITCDFGPKPQKTTDIAFVLGSHTSIGKCGFPILRALGNSKSKKGAVQPTIHVFDENNKKNNGDNNDGNNNNNNSDPPSSSASSWSEREEELGGPDSETGSSKWTGTIGGCAEIAVPPSLGDKANINYPSSFDDEDPSRSSSSSSPTSGSGNNNNSHLGASFKASLEKRRQAILNRLRGSASAKAATTAAERHKNVIRDVPLKTVWAYHASDDFIMNSDYVIGAMWFLIQSSAAWDIGWIIGGDDSPER